MLPPVIKTINVPCNQERAFRAFVEEMHTWWPLDRNSVSAMQGEVARAVVLEAKLTGRIIEVGHDGTEHVWGTVSEYQPFDRFAMDWHINLPREQASHVLVEFEAVGEDSTRVRLTHSNWEVFGERAAEMRAGYDSGWVSVFETEFAKACLSPSQVV